MKAAIFKFPKQPLVIERLPDPTPGEGQVVLKVARCGICGSDIHMTDTHGVLTPGAVLGHEFSGEVVAVGRGVNTLRMGDRVTALPISGCGTCDACRAGDPRRCRKFQFNGGGFAEYVATEVKSTLKLPEALTLTDGALVEPMAVAAHALGLVGNDIAGTKVLVVGAGPIGLAAAYWARRLGAAMVAVTASSHRRKAVAEAAGVEHFIVNDAQADSQLTELFGGLPDIVVECVGLPGTFARSLELVGARGTVIVAGACVQPDQFVPMVAMLKELRVLFSIMYSLDDFRASIDALDAGHLELRALVTGTIGMDQFVDTFESLRGPNPHCKVMLAPHG